MTDTHHTWTDQGQEREGAPSRTARPTRLAGWLTGCCHASLLTCRAGAVCGLAVPSAEPVLLPLASLAAWLLSPARPPTADDDVAGLGGGWSSSKSDSPPALPLLVVAGPPMSSAKESSRAMPPGSDRRFWLPVDGRMMGDVASSGRPPASRESSSESVDQPDRRLIVSIGSQETWVNLDDAMLQPAIHVPMLNDESFRSNPPFLLLLLSLSLLEDDWSIDKNQDIF